MKLDDSHLEEIESLLNQSLRGIHHLFENQEIARILATPTEDLEFFTFDNMDRVQELFSELVKHKSLDQKQAFLRRLDSDSYELLLRSYFHLVENSAMGSSELKH